MSGAALKCSWEKNATYETPGERKYLGDNLLLNV